jgi:hypothetical protein
MACDAAGDGLDVTEWACIFTKLGIEEDFATHEATYGSSFTAADTNTNNVIGYDGATGTNDADDEEPSEWISNLDDEDFRGAIVMAMLGLPPGGPGGMADELVNMVSPGMQAAEAVVKMALTIKENADDMWPDEKAALLTALLEALELSEIPPSDVKFTLTAGSSVAEASIFVPTQADADRASTASEANLGTPEAASEALGVEVEEITFSARASTPQSSTSGAIVVVIVAVVLGLVTCFGFAKRAAKTRRAAWNAEYEGCCSTGCCSAYALKGWALGTAVAGVFLLACAIPTYLEVAKVATGLQCIIDQVIALTKVEMMAEVAAPLEQGIGLVLPYRDQISLLPIAALVPAILAAVWMVITAICAAKTSATMCAAKCFCVMDFLLLLLSVVFYIIFAAIGWFITSPFAVDIIKQVTSTCDALVPTMKGMAATVNTLAETQPDNQDLSDMAADLEPAVAALEGACTCVVDIIFTLGALFSAGLLATFASFYCIFVIYGLCCSAKCCKKPEVTGSPNKVEGA